MSINQVAITGNLTRDPDMRQTASGMAVMTFCVAVNDRRRNSETGEWEDYANFVDCAMFGSHAQGLHPHLCKGLKVGVQGKLRWSQWEKDGQKRSKLQVVADTVDFLSRRQNQQEGNHQAQPQTTPQTSNQAPQNAFEAQAAFQANTAAQQPATAGVYDEDIPF